MKRVDVKLFVGISHEISINMGGSPYMCVCVWCSSVRKAFLNLYLKLNHIRAQHSSTMICCTAQLQINLRLLISLILLGSLCDVLGDILEVLGWDSEVDLWKIWWSKSGHSKLQGHT